MKLAFVAPAHPYRGGIAHFGVRLARELKNRHELLYINFSRLYPKRLFPGKTQFDESNLPVEFPTERKLDSISPLSWYTVGHRIRGWKPDAVIFHWWHPFFGPAYRGITMSLGKKTMRIAICHNVAPHEHGKLARQAVRYGLSKMNGFVVHSRSEERELDDLHLNNPRITLFHPLYDIFPGQDIPKSEARKRLEHESDDRIVLYFGMIRPYKGVDILLRAAEQLVDIPRLKILIVGEIYSGGTEIRRLIWKLPKGMVTLVDRYVSNEEVAFWFRAADIVALPYLSATQSGIVPIAYCCRRPVIVTCVGGLPDVVRNNETGYLIKPNDPEALADAIRKHFIKRGNPPMTAGIDAVCTELSWDRYSVELEHFIETIKQ